MNPIMRKRIRVMFLPYFICGIILIGLYALVRWQVNMKTHKLNVHYWLLNYIVPIAACLLLSVIVLWKRMFIIYFEDKNRKASIAASFAVAAVLLMPSLYFTQKYIDDSFFPLVHVKSVKDIAPAAQSAYYAIDSFYVDKDRPLHSYTESRRSKSSYYDYSIYFVLPMYTRATDTTDSAVSKVWYALGYKLSLSGSGNYQNKVLLSYIDRKDSSIRNTANVSGITYFKVLYSDALYSMESKGSYVTSIETQYGKIAEDGVVILEPMFDSFDNRNSDALKYMLLSYLGFAVGFFVMSVAPVEDDKTLAKYT